MAEIQILNINLVATWDYETNNKECVCNRSLHLPTVNQIENKNIYRNDITFGECGHGFHTECINSYLKTYNNMCPHDRLPFIKCKNNYKIKYNLIE